LPPEARDSFNPLNPGHYADLPIQPIQIIVANKLNYFEGNVLKYLLRHRNKNGVEDLKKAIRYLEMLIEFEETGAVDLA